MKSNYFFEILRKYREGTATIEEANFIEDYYRLFEMDPTVDMDLSSDELEDRLDLILREKILKKIYIPKENNRVAKRHPIRWLSVAAAILVIALGLLALFRDNNGSKKIAVSPFPKKNEKILPGSDKASLTLANGRTIDLSHLKNGRIAYQANVQVEKLGNGQINYIDPGKNTNNKEAYNVITTPNGGTYKLTLSDGSRVWLNAGSSLKFPVAFVGKERQIELKGEAYFEVVHNAKQPFSVKVGKMRLYDVGTHFNIKAYNNDPYIKTTLLEGAVKLICNQQIARLIPGQQASIEKTKSTLLITKVDTAMAIAWKNGLFRFSHTSIKTIMQELERWYNVQVTYNDRQLSDMKFSGVMSRYSNVADVLKRIELTGAVHFRIEGRQVIVTK